VMIHVEYREMAKFQIQEEPLIASDFEDSMETDDDISGFD